MNSKVPRIAPWIDSESNRLYEGSKVRHLSGLVGEVRCLGTFKAQYDRWRIRWFEERSGCNGRASLTRLKDICHKIKLIKPGDEQTAVQLTYQPAMTKWVPTTNLLELRRLGKMGEESGELSAAVSRCIIQGLDGVDPKNGKINRQWLEEEMGDVLAQIRVCIVKLRLNEDGIMARAMEKQRQQEEWEAMFGGAHHVN
jgi:NTP pyrophosphatase (non-canonical NTP hydrolase)